MEHMSVSCVVRVAEARTGNFFGRKKVEYVMSNGTFVRSCSF